MREEEGGKAGRTDRDDALPLDSLTLELGLADAQALLPVFELVVLRLGRLPVHLARVGVGRAREPPRRVRRDLAALACPARRALVLLELGLELVGAVELARLEGVLVGTQAAVGRRQPRLEVRVDVVERDGVRRPASATQRGQQLFRCGG